MSQIFMALTPVFTRRRSAQREDGRVERLVRRIDDHGLGFGVRPGIRRNSEELP